MGVGFGWSLYAGLSSPASAGFGSALSQASVASSAGDAALAGSGTDAALADTLGAASSAGVGVGLVLNLANLSGLHAPSTAGRTLGSAGRATNMSGQGSPSVGRVETSVGTSPVTERAPLTFQGSGNPFRNPNRLAELGPVEVEEEEEEFLDEAAPEVLREVPALQLAMPELSPALRNIDLSEPGESFDSADPGIGCSEPGLRQGIGFGSYRAFTRRVGPAGPDQEWHHIVEQTPGNRARFGSTMINNTGKPPEN